MTKEQAKIKFLMAGDVNGNSIVDIADLPKFKQYITKDAAVPFLGPEMIKNFKILYETNYPESVQ